MRIARIGIGFVARDPLRRAARPQCRSRRGATRGAASFLACPRRIRGAGPCRLFGARLALAAHAREARAWRPPTVKAASTFFAAFALNNVLPLRAGDIYRCVAASRFPDGTIAKSLATLLTERLLDLAALTVCPERSRCSSFPTRASNSISLPIAAILMLGVFVLGLLIAFPVAARRLVNAVARGFEDVPIRGQGGGMVRRGSAWRSKARFREAPCR